MGITLKPEYLKRYKDIAMLLVKYGRTDLVTSTGLDAVLGDDKPTGTNGGAPTEADQKGEELTADLEAMGPIYVKIGQVLSSRADLLPAPYTNGARSLAG
jgi:ubiquinone biosynthesis protein